MSKKSSLDTKSPDAFQVTMYKLLDWAIKSKKILIGITLPIVFMVAGFWGWQVVSSSKAEARRYDLAGIDDMFAKEKERHEE